MNPVSDEKVKTAIQRLTENPKLSASRLARDEGWGKTTAWRAWKAAKEYLEREERDNGLTDNPGTELMEGSQVARVQGDTRGSRGDQATGPPKYSRPSKINDSTGKRVSRFKVEKVKTWLAENPNLKIVEVKKKLNCSDEPARLALRSAQEEILEEAKDLRDKAQQLKRKQQEKALQALESQMDRTEELPAILRQLRKDTFEMDNDGNILGIRKMAKSFNKAGDPIYLTPASVVNEYLEVEKRVLEQERLVNGITQAERIAEKAASPKPELTLQLPITPDQLDQIKPV